MTRETVLLIEDEVGLREFIQMYLTKKGYEVVTAEDGEEGIEKAEYIQPEVILLDIGMPGIDGFTVCKEIRMKMTTPILFISCRKDVIDKIKCFKLGGDDYITKPFNFAELEARIQASLRQHNNQPLSKQSQVIKQGELKLDVKRLQCHIQGDLVALTVKEMKLLILLAKHPNQVWSAEQLYDHVWGFNYAGDISTVKVHISRLRKKLETNTSKPKHILTVRGFGYLFAGH